MSKPNPEEIFPKEKEEEENHKIQKEFSRAQNPMCIDRMSLRKKDHRWDETPEDEDVMNGWV